MNISQALTHKQLLTKEQAAVFLQVSTATVERWMRDEKIQPIRIGRTVRFSKENLINAGKNN